MDTVFRGSSPKARVLARIPHREESACPLANHGPSQRQDTNTCHTFASPCRTCSRRTKPSRASRTCPASLEQEFAGKVSDIRQDWDGNTAHFSFTAVRFSDLRHGGHPAAPGRDRRRSATARGPVQRPSGRCDAEARGAAAGVSPGSAGKDPSPMPTVSFVARIKKDWRYPHRENAYQFVERPTARVSGHGAARLGDGDRARDRARRGRGRAGVSETRGAARHDPRWRRRLPL